MSYFDKKVAVVTGGSAGLGQHICQSLAKRGCTVVSVARDSQRQEQVRAELRKTGVQLQIMNADVTNPEDVTSLFQSVAQKFGRLDILVNNVGRSSRGTITDVEPGAFRELFEINFISMVQCTRAALPLLESTKGHIVNIGSLASKIATPLLGAYPASKFAVAAYTQQLRLALRAKGVHVLLVCPGPVKRDDAGHRYEDQRTGLPDSARNPAAGARVSPIDPEDLAARIVLGVQRRKAELILPRSARFLAAISQLSPSIGDWIVRRKT